MLDRRRGQISQLVAVDVAATAGAAALPYTIELEPLQCMVVPPALAAVAGGRSEQQQEQLLQ